MTYYERLRKYADPGFRNPQFHKMPREATNLFSGVELEMEGQHGEGSLNNVLDAIDAYNESDHMWEVKLDGSLDQGLECVTHPFSFRYYQEQMDENLKTLFGVLSTESAPWDKMGKDRAGCHIHVSRNAFAPDHLYRFMAFHYENPEFCRKMSGRGTFRYSSFNVKGNRLDYGLQREETPEVTADDRIYLEQMSRNQARNDNRYQAINLNHRGTAELRYFRGTNKLERFRAYIEMVYALYAYTKPLRTGSVDGFIKFLTKHESDFPNALALATDAPTHRPEMYKDMKPEAFRQGAQAVAARFID